MWSMLIKRLTVTLPSEAWKTRMEKGRSTKKKNKKKRMKIVDGWQKTEQRTWTVSKFCLEQMMHSFWVVDKSWAVSLIHFNKESLRVGSKIIVLDRQRRIKINLQNCLFCFLELLWAYRAVASIVRNDTINGCSWKIVRWCLQRTW